MDRWEKTVRAPIRLDMFVEIPLIILFLMFGTWQLFLCSKRKELSQFIQPVRNLEQGVLRSGVSPWVTDSAWLGLGFVRRCGSRILRGCWGEMGLMSAVYGLEC
jgi:hypothetical protein